VDLVRTTWRGFLSTVTPGRGRRSDFGGVRDLGAVDSLDLGDRAPLPVRVAEVDAGARGDVVVSHRVEDLEWTVQTGLVPEDVRAAGRVAAAGGPDDGALREDLTNAGSVSYAVVDPDSLATQMTLVVNWHELGGGRREVSLTVRGHLARRRRLLGVLPVGPTVLPAWAPAERFSTALRERLTEG
jgi:hypothetical protein